ncbi:MAG: crossover junction endodeoxyribonuclease RuvC [Clostridiaceae bacterium]|nr:crossover junction endodeoxyribonuclease RuvC [Clostridiaceae bacterium]
MVILGIDPGIAIVGYGIIRYRGNRFTVIDYGAVTTPSALSLPVRLNIIYDSIEKLIDQYRPDAVTVEELFFNKNAKTALAVGQGRGVAILAAARKGLNIYEYTPLQVKQSVAGYGRAEKIQVQQMVKVILGLNAIPKPDDVADALAVAICHAHSVNMNERLRYL